MKKIYHSLCGYNLLEIGLQLIADGRRNDTNNFIKTDVARPSILRELPLMSEKIVLGVSIDPSIFKRAGTIL